MPRSLALFLSDDLRRSTSQRAETKRDQEIRDFLDSELLPLIFLRSFLRKKRRLLEFRTGTLYTAKVFGLTDPGPIFRVPIGWNGVAGPETAEIVPQTAKEESRADQKSTRTRPSQIALGDAR